MAARKQKDGRPACAWVYPGGLRSCIYKAAQGERFCVRHLIETKVLERDAEEAA